MGRAMHWYGYLPATDRLKGLRAGFRHGVVLVAGAAADADRADDFPVTFQGDAAGEDHDFPVVGSVDSEELAAGLGVRGEILGGNVEGARGVGLFHGNVDATDPCAVHAHVSHDVAAFIGYSDVHGLSD